VFAIKKKKQVSIEQQLILLGVRRGGDMLHLHSETWFIGDSKGEAFSPHARQ
jgi:hypothetical protein